MWQGQTGGLKDRHSWEVIFVLPPPPVDGGVVKRVGERLFHLITIIFIVVVIDPKCCQCCSCAPWNISCHDSWGIKIYLYLLFFCNRWVILPCAIKSVSRDHKTQFKCNGQSFSVETIIIIYYYYYFCGELWGWHQYWNIAPASMQ